jgi:6-phosphogluconolactonase (cycloisomerase 2 family)
MKKIAYVGCRTTKERNASGKGLKVYNICDDGEWKEVQIINDLINPSYQCFDEGRDFLYTVHGDINTVSSFKINKSTGKLSHLNTVDSGGRNPVFITSHKKNQYIYVASLQGGAVSVLKRNDDGSLTNPIFKSVLSGRTKADVSHPHQCMWDKNGKYLIVPAQGRKDGFCEVNVFKSNDDGSLTLVSCHMAEKGHEPRHAAFHSNNRFLYVVNEKGNSASFYIFDDNDGSLLHKQEISTLPESYEGEGQASAIVIHPNNKFLYVSNRIHDSIAEFEIDELGYLKCIAHTDCMGKTPRFMTFSPDGKQLLVANEDSHTIKIFDVEDETGKLNFSGETIETESPVCVVFL